MVIEDANSLSATVYQYLSAENSLSSSSTVVPPALRSALVDINPSYGLASKTIFAIVDSTDVVVVFMLRETIYVNI